MGFNRRKGDQMKRCGSVNWVAVFGVPVAILVSACGPASGPYGVLNERLLELPSMTVSTSNCVGVNFGAMARSPSIGGAPPDSSGLIVNESIGAKAMLVEVTDGDRIVVQRTYDEPFFRSGSVDQFTATSTSGASMMLRFWGAWDADQPPPCAPQSDDGGRPSGP
jgi:hypothetical protein